VLRLLFFGQGLIMPLLRLFEPYFFVLAFKNVKLGTSIFFACITCKSYRGRKDATEQVMRVNKDGVEEYAQTRKS
jgi:hypothetical protein